jgi:hypothetical protein
MRLPLSFLPEGGLTITRQLTAGFAIAIALSPKGTAEYLALLKKHLSRMTRGTSEVPLGLMQPSHRDLRFMLSSRR